MTEPARRELLTSDAGDVDPMSGALSSAADKPAIASPPQTSNLPALKALIANHRRLLSNVRRSNHVIQSDNSRMEGELADRRAPVPLPATPQIAAASVDASEANAKLVWIESYIQGTFAQTLWALNARAAQLEQQGTGDQKQQTQRMLELTHLAYDQVRALIAWLHGDAND